MWRPDGFFFFFPAISNSVAYKLRNQNCLEIFSPADVARTCILAFFSSSHHTKITSQFTLSFTTLSPPKAFMEISQIEAHQITETIDKSASQNTPGPPHEALFLATAYLPVLELLAMSEVCSSLRDSVKNDILPWLNIVVERPLNKRLCDGNLMQIAAMAKGKLRTLALVNCSHITDDGLQWVVQQNPRINKVWIFRYFSGLFLFKALYMYVCICWTIQSLFACRGFKFFSLNIVSLRLFFFSGTL